MTPATKAMIVGGSLAFIGVVGGLYYGTRDVQPGGARYAEVDWDAPVPPDAKCLRTTGLAAPHALALFRIDAGTPGSHYVYCRICASPADAGEDEHGAVPLPPGMEALAEFQYEEDFDGGPQLRCSLDDFPAACSPGLDSGCEWNGTEDGGWEPAPTGFTLNEGQWRGNCKPKPPVELAGVSSWPPECPQ